MGRTDKLCVKLDCDVCALKPKCCPKLPMRKVPRSIYEKTLETSPATTYAARTK